VEKDNPVDNLTSEQLRAIYHGDITNWKEVGGKDQAIRAFQRPKNSGSQTMMEYFMGDVSLREPETYEIADAMTGVIEEVAQYANEAGAIGYSFRYFIEELNQEKDVKILSVDGVYPTMENIESAAYPQTGYVCLITRKNETNPYVQKMKEFILSEDGQYIIRQTGYAGLEQKNE
jgi:phosphate transport system substrate-binding protein